MMQKVIEIRNTFQLAIIALQINLIGDDTATEESLRIEINCLVICFFFSILRGILEKIVELY